MRILIDSHVLVWSLDSPDKLSAKAKELLRSATEVYVSTATVWELTIKYYNRKLPYSPDVLLQNTVSSGFEQMPVLNEHLLALPKIRLPHKDPFDRLLMAQSEAEGCTFMTADTNIMGAPYRVVSAI